ncbi:MAG: aminotransferase class I/II-fold pyridoxal phosphate-dependent enzyme [Clostridia bacterium]|nr:aminotransferase class I/II-fold pyridoxal phosphate-dependent enzyme [Clostridia bacterium]
MDKETSLLDRLMEMQKKDLLPMHMPGHKRNAHVGSKLPQVLQSRIGELDFTEIPGLDDLHSPSEIMDKAQKLAARCFGAKETFFLVNGCTVGIQSAVMALCGEGEEAAVSRNLHRSIFEGLVLSGAKPLYYHVSYDKELGIPLGPRLEDVRELIKNNSPKAVLMVHPTYYGTAADMGIIEEAHRRGAAVIVDEAHGAHLKFDFALPPSSLEAGADVVVHGTHKTLGSLTQTGLLHLGSQRVRVEDIKRCLSLLQTTSPSYILMASLDAMCHDLAEGDLVKRAVEAALLLRDKVKKIPGFYCWEPEGLYDPTKIVLGHRDMSGKFLGCLLREKYGIYPELEEEGFVLLMITVGDSPETVLKVVEALEDISTRFGGEIKEKNLSKKRGDAFFFFDELPLVILTPREAFFYRRRRKIPLSLSKGEVCGEMIVPYPPGVPVLLPGERISESIVEYLLESINKGCNIQGLDRSKDPEIEILEC